MNNNNKDMHISYADDVARVLSLKRANRHGLIAGATGTGKTVTIQKLAEQFSSCGVPVFISDVKGDLSGIGSPMPPKQMGKFSQVVSDRNPTALHFPAITPEGFPVNTLDVFASQGTIPLNITAEQMGPQLLARVLALSPVQTGVLQALFKVAEREATLLITLDDLMFMVKWAMANSESLRGDFGNMTLGSLGAIQRALLGFEQEGGGLFFGEPAFDVRDLLQLEAGGGGRGVISLLKADKLLQQPRLYASILLYLLDALWRALPEVGDLEKPRLVLFFDEAHLLFTKDTPRELLGKIELTVRLIRSKGVGVYLGTQSPADVPESVLGQLGNRWQHALRAFTPKDQKAVKSAAATMRPNPELKRSPMELLTQLPIGAALVSTLDDTGVPTPVELCYISPPNSRVGGAETPPPIENQEMESFYSNSFVNMAGASYSLPIIDRYPRNYSTREIRTKNTPPVAPRMKKMKNPFKGAVKVFSGRKTPSMGTIFKSFF